MPWPAFLSASSTTWIAPTSRSACYGYEEAATKIQDLVAELAL
ncbi:MAG TPA: hypothetical protein VET45_00505 [Candidatus Binatia bacterium]|nr:hypothetical protein [Candidatus Binatia bacterium]